MAPEQIRGQKVTPATDVFALGATLYYLCTGESAFSADFADGVLYRARISSLTCSGHAS